MKIQTLLKDRMNYAEQDAEMLAERLNALQPPLQPLLTKWVESGAEEDDTMYHGYSINSLRCNGNMNFIAALLTLDWILREPEKATAMIRRGIK